MYAELLFADDDDGDLSNGTPHGCAINQAMGRHGLRPVAGTVTAAVTAVTAVTAVRAVTRTAAIRGRSDGRTGTGAG